MNVRSPLAGRHCRGPAADGLVTCDFAGSDDAALAAAPRAGENFTADALAQPGRSRSAYNGSNEQFGLARHLG